MQYYLSVLLPISHMVLLFIIVGSLYYKVSEALRSTAVLPDMLVVYSRSNLLQTILLNRRSTLHSG